MAKVDLGQHFLISKRILRRICNYAELSKEDIVYEIGAGFGNLTEEIAKRVRKVYAIEIDPKLYEMLKENLSDYENIVPILGDAVVHEIPEDCNKVVGNLPFSISSLITEKVLREMANCRIELIVFMYQREFAERVVAKPGNKEFSRISFLCQYYSKPELLELVPKHLFKPRPKVDAAIVRFRKKDVEWDEKLNKFVKILFTQKKKKVINSLSSKIEKKVLKEKLKTDLLEKRVFKLKIEEILRLKEMIENEFPEFFEENKEKD